MILYEVVNTFAKPYYRVFVLAKDCNEALSMARTRFEEYAKLQEDNLYKCKLSIASTTSSTGPLIFDEKPPR